MRFSSSICAWGDIVAGGHWCCDWWYLLRLCIPDRDMDNSSVLLVAVMKTVCRSRCRHRQSLYVRIVSLWPSALRHTGIVHNTSGPPVIDKSYKYFALLTDFSHQSRFARPQKDSNSSFWICSFVNSKFTKVNTKHKYINCALRVNFPIEVLQQICAWG